MSDEPHVTVDRDTLEQWIEDALTQGIAPTEYIFGVLTAALPGDDLNTPPQPARRSRHTTGLPWGHGACRAPTTPLEEDEAEFIQCPHETIRATCAGGCNCPCAPCAPSRRLS